MDLRTMETKLNNSQYKSPAQFAKDVALIVRNCRDYNAPESTYCRCAGVLEEKFRETMAKHGFADYVSER
jgi:hypothetical protein